MYAADPLGETREDATEPLLESYWSAFAEIDADPRHRLIVAELDPSFARAVVNLLRDKDLRAGLALEARRTAERRFGWDAIAQDALDSYAELTALPVAAPVRALAQHA